MSRAKKAKVKIILYILLWLSPFFCTSQEMPDFGPDGLAGLTAGQRQTLERGEVVLPRSVAQTPEGKTLIEAALVFQRPPEEVWRLLSRTEDQVKYIDNIKKIAIISKSPLDDELEFTTKILTKTFVFRVAHHFDEKNLYIHWSLNKTFPSDLKDLQGFWRLYDFGEGRTLARYGSLVAPNFSVPRFIYNALVKNDLRSVLAAAKRHIDSGGSWEKKQSRRHPEFA